MIRCRSSSKIPSTPPPRSWPRTRCGPGGRRPWPPPERIPCSVTASVHAVRGEPRRGGVDLVEGTRYRQPRCRWRLGGELGHEGSVARRRGRHPGTVAGADLEVLRLVHVGEARQGSFLPSSRDNLAGDHPSNWSFFFFFYVSLVSIFWAQALAANRRWPWPTCR